MSSPRELVELYGRLGERIASHIRAEDALAAVTQVAVDIVDGADFASMTRDRGDHYQTLGPTEATATEADRLQYDLDSGPCVWASSKGGTYTSGDLAADERWPVYGPQAATRFGIASVLSVGMVIEDDIRAGLNVYSRTLDSFDERAQTLCMLLATHGGLAVSRVVERERASNLELALANSRQIGTAIGILMSSRKVTAEQAFAMLRISSQASNRRVRSVADDVVTEGELSLPE